jgi:predicted MFS family arabinose efflux permease
VHPERTARGYSMIYGASSFAALAGPMGFGVIGDQFGIAYILIAMAVTAIIAILPCWFLKTASG